MCYICSGPAKFVRLGDLNLYNNRDNAQPQNFTIAQIVRHPDYSFRFAYNDIALLKLDRPVEINLYVRPACLYENDSLPHSPLPIATGWGATQYLGDTSDDLIKVVLNFTAEETCTKPYTQSVRALPNGVLYDQQFCAGYNHWESAPRDTCQVSNGQPEIYQKNW